MKRYSESSLSFGMYVLVICGGQRAASGIIPQKPSTLFWGAGALTVT